MKTIASALVDSTFSSTYAGSKARFLQAAAEAGGAVRSWLAPHMAGPDGGSLSVDVCVVGNRSSRKALVIVSGTHGQEGFTGSAAQVALLRALSAATREVDCNIVLIHAINPYGFAHISRTTENNVDLNRNFIDWTQPVPANTHYDELHDVICPADFEPETLRAGKAKLDAWLKDHSFNEFLDASIRGQYTNAKGRNYGGSGREWSNVVLEQICSEYLRDCSKIALIDWHTGLGKRGQPFFLCFNERGGEAWQRACSWWGTERLESNEGFSGGPRPNYKGLLFYGMQKFLPDAELTGAVIEFGTEPLEVMRKALQLDLQLRFGGSIGEADRPALREQLLEWFYPSSSIWRREVLGHALQIQDQAVAGLHAW